MSKDEKDPNSPATTSEAWDSMIGRWSRIETLLSGTESMRAAGDVYLPQHAEELDKDYRDRLRTTTLFNMFELTLSNLVGKPFSDPIKLADDTPPEIREILTNVDLQGNDLTTFTRQWFREGIAKGFSHVLVEMPRIRNSEELGRPRTRQDDIDENIRPYWVHVKPEDVFFMHSEIRPNGTEKLMQVRMMEMVTEMSGFAQVFVPQIRVLFPGGWVLYRLKEPDKRKKDEEWAVFDQGETGLDFIPFITFYADRDGLGLAKPPLEDLAFANIAHWQSSSDQRNILTVARFPLLAVAGINDATGDVLRIGPRQLLGTRNENGRFYYVEHEGAAIQAGERDLQNLENQMASYGAEFLRKRPGNPTATARALDSAEATSPLQDMTRRFSNAVTQAMGMSASSIGIENGGSATYTTDFGPDETKDIDFRSLLEGRRNRDLSRDNFLLELKRRGALADEFDIEKNLEQLESEPLIVSPFATGINTPVAPEDKGVAPEDEGADKGGDPATTEGGDG
jgi:hypothetical protein